LRDDLSIIVGGLRLHEQRWRSFAARLRHKRTVFRR
jgi:hypothetical protein